MMTFDPLFPPQAILVDRSFKILYVGETARRYLGYEQGMPSDRLPELVHPDLRPQITAALPLARESDETYEYSKLPVTIDDHAVFVNLRIRRLRYPVSHDVRLLVSFEEVVHVTESQLFFGGGSESWSGASIQQLQEDLFAAELNLRIKTEHYETIVEEMCAANEELRNNADEMATNEQNLHFANEQLAEKVAETTALNADLENLIAATAVAIVFLNSRLQVKRFTPRAAELFNLFENDLGRPITDFATQLDYRELAAEMRQVLHSKQSQEREVSDADGNIYLARLQPYKTGDEQTDGVIINLIDISARKKTEESLRQSEERLQMSQKLESIGRLAGGVAHDFNNMLTAIIGYSDLGLKTLDVSHPIHKYFEQIKMAGEQSAALTKQLLAFSRRQIMQPKEISLDKIVVETESLLGRLNGEDITIRLELDAAETIVQVDPTQLTQVIVNLAINARHAMPHGGELLIKTRRVRLEENSLEDFVAPSGIYANLSVSDTGTGIEEEVRHHIFEPFYTTKKIGEGTGLGLATVYGIIKQLNGYIAVESELGCGTTFDIYLPLA